MGKVGLSSKEIFVSHLVTTHTHPQPLSTGVRIGDKGPGGKNGQGYRDVLSLASLESGISPLGVNTQVPVISLWLDATYGHSLGYLDLPGPSWMVGGWDEG